MMFSVALTISYLSSGLKTKLAQQIQSTTLDEKQSASDNGPATKAVLCRNSPFSTFIQDKLGLAVFKMGFPPTTYQSHLQNAEGKVTLLAAKCKALRQELQTVNKTNKEAAKEFATKFDRLVAEHAAEVVALQREKKRLERNVDNILRGHLAVKEERDKMSSKLKMAEAKLQANKEANKTGLAEKNRYELEAKHAQKEERFAVKLSEEKANFDSKIKQQQDDFDAKCKQLQSTFDKRWQKQIALYESKYAEQDALFDTKCEQLGATFDATYKAQQGMFDTKCIEQKAAFEAKLQEREARFQEKLQEETRKYELLQNQHDTVSKRLKSTKAVLLRSRQVKVNQEYTFKDTVNSLVPREALMTVQDQCVLYKKTVSVLAVMVLILMGVIFVGSRFLYQ